MHPHYHLSATHSLTVIAACLLILLVLNYRQPIRQRIRLRVLAGVCVGILIGLVKTIVD